MQQLRAAAACQQARQSRPSNSAAAAAASRPLSSLVSSPRADVRSLCAHLPSRERALQQQRQNLEQFLADNAAAYAAFPYQPWTKQARSFGVSTRIGISSLAGCVGLRGVMLEAAEATSDKEQPLVYYPGLLMTEAMYESFASMYHCPTAL
jgi:hypothetical protein